MWNGDELVLRTSTQHIYGVRDGVAAALGLPLHKVRAICEFMGAGFGSKQGAGKHEVIAALLAKMTERPVRLYPSRRAENLIGGVRHLVGLQISVKRCTTFRVYKSFLHQGKTYSLDDPTFDLAP
ncbi:MAG: molybdopterin-dependent oxidoreductase [Chloroflexi bacterium]|nr:molybdopterin-dependent oxidoreductase [Chloroflexota bacterium]